MIRSRSLPLLLALGVIAFWTLLPSADREPEPFSVCLLCGSRGTADAILNLLLFIPLGAAISRIGGWKLALSVGFLASALVEICQTRIPGREPTAGDLLFNSLGALIGYLAVRALASSARRSGREAPATIAATGLASLLILAGLIRAPALPESTYYGQWTPELGRSAPFPGRLLSARVDGLVIPNQRLANSDRIRERLLAGESIEVVAVADRQPRRRSLLFSIHDEHEREIVSLAVQGADLLASYGSRLEALRLEPSAARFPGLLRDVEPADTFTVSFSMAGSSAAVWVDGGERSGVRSYSPGEGWRLLISGSGSPSGPGALISLLWLAGLTLPVGYFALRSAPLLVVGTCIVYLAMAAAYSYGLRSLPIGELIAPLVGALLGRLIAGRVASSIADPSAGSLRPLPSPEQRSAPPSPAASG